MTGSDLKQLAADSAAHAISVAAIITAVLIGLAQLAPAQLPACPTEDSVSCHWDAGTQGNGAGRSFDVDADGNVTYTSGDVR